MQNRFPGKCACDAWVDAGQGVAVKADGRWIVRCDYCERQASAPEREMLGTIYWPNGMGETVCTLDYEEAVFNAEQARSALAEYAPDYNPHDDESRQHSNHLEHLIYEAENKVAELQLAGGHLGERITYAQADPMAALLGGGRITVQPSGLIGIAE